MHAYLILFLKKALRLQKKILTLHTRFCIKIKFSPNRKGEI